MSKEVMIDFLRKSTVDWRSGLFLYVQVEVARMVDIYLRGVIEGIRERNVRELSMRVCGRRNDRLIARSSNE